MLFLENVRQFKGVLCIRCVLVNTVGAGDMAVLTLAHSVLDYAQYLSML